MGSELKVFGFRVCGLVFRVYGVGCLGSGSGCGVGFCNFKLGVPQS